MDKDSVLVVDDDAIVLRLMARAIEQAGVGAVTTTDPHEALDLLRNQRFQVLLTDLLMDGLDGLSLFSAARRQDPLLRGICFSGHLDQGVINRLLAAGFDDGLIKPVRKDDLLPSLARSLEIRRHWLSRIATIESAPAS